MDELLDYVQKHPEDERLSHLLEHGWHTKNANIGDSGPSWAEMREAMTNTRVTERARQSQITLWRVAACILVLVATYVGFSLLQKPDRAHYAESASLITNTVETTRTEHRLIVLPDGSKVWINGSSKIVSAPDFNKRTREVTLYGEAFFDIHRDADRPFIISAGDVKTTVLGTAFNIRAFPEEGEVTVTVARGKVLVQAENQEAGTVTANQQITVNLQSDKVEANEVDAASVTEWIKDDLILHEVTLDEVEEILEDLYAVDIVFENAGLKGCRFTSTFLKDATLQEILTAICLVNDATFTINDKVITLHGEGCSTER